MRSNIIQRYTTTDRFIWFITFAFFIVFNVVSASGSLMLGFTLIVLVASNFRLTFYKFHVFTLTFVLYCYATTFWAMNGRFTLDICNSMFLTLMCVFVFYDYWKDVKDINILLKVLMWSGFVIVVYTYFYYGVEDVIVAEQEERLDTTFNNVNVIAMQTALTLVINYYFFLFVKKDWSVLMWIPGFFIIGATQSRKALVMLIIGVFMLYYFKQRNVKGKDMVPFLKMLAFIIGGIVLLFLLSKTNMFSGMTERMNGLIASVTGEGSEDASSMTRRIYRESGWRQFLRTPFLGCGINNSMIFLSYDTGHITYTHCNYAELAACGGIVGLISYYSMYLYVLFKEMKYIKIDSSAVLIFTWILIRLVTDWGAVSYCSKTTYFYLMIYFIHLDNMKRKYPKIK